MIFFVMVKYICNGGIGVAMRINLFVDSNEPYKRFNALCAAVSSRGDDLFCMPTRANLSVDLMATYEHKAVFVEVKEAKDLIMSYKDERLYKQIMSISSSGHSGFVLVIATDAEVFSQWPSYTGKGPKTAQQKLNEFKAMMSFLNNASCNLGVPTHFRAINPYGEFLSLTHHILIPDCGVKPPKMSRRSMNNNAYAAYILSRYPGIGLDTAKSLIKEFGSVHAVNCAACSDIETIMNHVHNGRKIGKKVIPGFEIIGAI